MPPRRRRRLLNTSCRPRPFTIPTALVLRHVVVVVPLVPLVAILVSVVTAAVVVLIVIPVPVILTVVVGRSTVSNAVKVRYGRGFGRRVQSTSYHVRDAAIKQQAAVKKYKERIAGLDYVAREQLQEMEVDPDGWEDDPDLFPIPPGDEGVLASHVGGEVDLCMDLLGDQRKRYDHRTRRDRTQSRNSQWAPQIPSLTDAYLAWRRNRGETNSSTLPASSEPSEECPDEDRSFSVTVIEFFGTCVRPFARLSPSEQATVALARHGVLGVSPLQPSIAIAFDVLEAFRQLHGFCPRLSIQAFCQALCGIHHLLYRRHHAEQFSNAYDVYLDILHKVDAHVNVALGRDTANWRMLNACAPCLNRIEGEEDLEFDLMAAIDGNSSMKLVDDTFRSGQSRPDGRSCRTDVIMPPEEVDQFKDEVSSAQKKRPPVPDVSAVPDPYHAFRPPDAAPPLPIDNIVGAGGGEVTDGDAAEHGSLDEGGGATADHVEEPCDSKSVCAERWRNAGPEARKKMFALFAATGIFVCLCRHGQVLIMCDMIRSGELMKYALAIANKLLDVYGPNAKIKVGYDIGCEFSKTLTSSSLGPRAAGRLTCVVPAFHGHSHNRACQLQWHPMYMSGVGLEDFEVSERFFSFSNGAAAGTRLATAFHRHQAIEGVVAFWGAQKHLASGKFIYNNYRQALRIIDEGERVLDVYSRDLNLSAADYERYLDEERAYLQRLRAEPADVSLKCEYIEALQELEQQRMKDVAAIDAYKNLDYLIVKEGITANRIRAIQREYRFAQTRVQRAEEKVQRLEEQLDIDVRWLPASQEYRDAAAEMGLRRYRRALDNLERLVVQRLFELKKLGMNGIGYKLREKIGQALKTRAQAIRTALAAYNREAAALNPPRPELTWTEIMNMVSVGEFDILRDAREDIRSRPWAQAPNRDGTNTYFKVVRAREEIRRLNVEIRRLFSALIDEHVDFVRAIERIQELDPPLAHELEERQRYRSIVSASIVGWLVKTSRLAGFTGHIAYGHRLGREKSTLDGALLPSWATYASDDGDHSGDVEDEDLEEVDMEDGDGIPGVGGAGASGRFVAFVDGLDGLDRRDGPDVPVSSM
ncbi:hypothetical protein ACG7TL_001788 [Trametes sanguinea]